MAEKRILSKYWIDPEKDAEITAITDREERNAAWKAEMQRLEDLILQQARKEWK